MGSSEPLLWMLHGGPGAGKSFVVETLRKHVFEGVMGWEHGLDFQVAALQAANASSLDGHTLHAAFGMTPHGASTESGRKRGEPGAKKVEAAKRIQQWRWLIIDEIRM
eukprot:7422111-Pyramimonas_sp.AAC.1